MKQGLARGPCFTWPGQRFAWEMRETGGRTASAAHGWQNRERKGTIVWLHLLFWFTWMEEPRNGFGAASFPFRHPLGRSSLAQS
ncbi:hypothetical protein B1694_10560 [Geobacillus zalihae]|nr:hypothetical protein I656_03169 [Geobacillus sp. WSUCF1]OQP22508.1 hypothetical protein B1694_10560 [Geobacillus zalihae]